MNRAKLTICLSASLCCLMVQANDEVPSLPASALESVAGSPARSLGPFSLEFKGQGMSDWPQHDPAKTSGRIAARLYGQGDLSGSFGIELNTRLRTQISSREHYQAERNIRLDVQSLAFSYNSDPAWRWLAGRTNIRNGVASGFNPTDWFKDNSLVIVESLDIADRREDRLGVVALTGIWLNTDSVLSFGYRPNLHAKPDTLGSNADIAGLGLDRTNNRDAFFVKYAPAPASWNNLSLTLSSLYQNDQPSLGAELSLAVRDNLIVYGEWFSQRRQSLADEAVLSNPGEMRLYNQLATGLTWSIPDSMVANQDISLSVEYHVNEAGLKQAQLGLWRESISRGDHQARSVGLLAGVKQEPLAQQQLFGRLAWNDFWADNDVSLITTVTPMDGSGFSQLTFSVPVTPALRFDLQGYHYFGNADTIYGSTGRKDGVMLSLVYTI